MLSAPCRMLLAVILICAAWATDPNCSEKANVCTFEDENLTLQQASLLNEEQHAISNNEECGLYVAPSTIPNGGVGIFTVNALQPGEIVGYGDITIPIIDFAWLLHGDDSNPFASYVWHYQDSGMHYEIDQFHIEAMSAFGPGLDCAVNMHPALVNAERRAPRVDTTTLHRSKHAGAGAITPYHNGITRASHYVPAGGELFKYYGDDWLTERGLDHVPNPEAYEEAERVSKYFAKLLDDDKNMSSNHKDALWNIVQDWPWWTLQGRNALPGTVQDVLQAARQGIRSLYQPSALRSVQELQTTGRCMDNIRGGVSTLEGAGRGAFASRPILNNTIITGSGLLALPNWDLVDMLDARDETLKEKQILLNYCYSHSQTTLLLCPYGSGVGYINHNATMANVKIQWAPHGMLGQDDDWFERELLQDMKDGVHLAFDYVTTRDIEEGEELFMDYGDEWVEAWEAHVREWKPPVGSQDYATAQEWNERLKHQVLKTRLEQECDPYPTNLLLRCHSDIEVIEKDWMDWSQEWGAEEAGQECFILYRSQDEQVPSYWVEVQDKVSIRLYHVPRGAFKFFDKPYSKDHQLPNVFRHPIMIPDEMFPHSWRNLRQQGFET